MAKQLTEKELMYISDCLEIEEKEVKKFKDASAQASDAELRNALSSISQLHQNHFDTLKQHLS